MFFITIYFYFVVRFSRRPKGASCGEETTDILRAHQPFLQAGQRVLVIIPAPARAWRRSAIIAVISPLNCSPQ